MRRTIGFGNGRGLAEGRSLALLFGWAVVALALSACVAAQPDPEPRSEPHGPGIIALPSAWTPTAGAGASGETLPPQPTTAGIPEASQATPQPAETATPTPAATMKPLSPQGPWLVVCDNDRQIVISDETGSQARIPTGGNCYEQAAISAASHRLAFLARGTGGGPSLRVLELPGLDVVGEASFGDINPADVEQFSWSPDGAVLAYVVLPRAQPAQLYAYEVGQESGRLLESREGQISIMDWSPDSRWLVALSGQGRLEEVWARAIVGASSRIVYAHPSDSDTFYWGSILGWTDRSTFVMEEGPGEGCSYGLREFSLDSGAGRVLYNAPFVDARLDPASKTVFLGIPEPGLCGFDLAPGIYQISLASPSPRRILAGRDWERLLWLGALGPLGLRVSGPPGIQAYSAEGKQRSFFADAAELHISPDGAWVLARTVAGGLRLADDTGFLVRDISAQSPREVVWLPDSSAFYVLEDGGAVYRMAVQGEDRPTQAAESAVRILGVLAP